MAICGIDNGLDGALVIISGQQFVKVTCHVAPTLGSGTRELDEQRMRELLVSEMITHAFVEAVQAMPGQGLSSTLKIGIGGGLWRGILVGLQIPYEIVRPQVWQKEMFAGVGGDDTKLKSALVAQRLHPDVDWRKNAQCRVVHDGLTDAFCIAEWGRRQLAKRNGTAA